MVNEDKKLTAHFFHFLGISSLILIVFVALPVGTGDTTELIKGSESFKSCLFDRNSSSCQNLERFGFTPHLISFLLLEIYPNNNVVIVLWSLINFFAFIIIIFILYNYFYLKFKADLDSRLFFIGLAFSPLAAYSVYSFSEMIFVLLGILLIHFLYLEKYFLAILPGILAIAYKDNAFLTLVPLMIAILLIRKFNKFKLSLVLVIFLLGIIVNLLFNKLRFGGLTNETYQANGAVLDFKTNITHFLAVWLSPSGGVIGYFFLLPILVILIFLLRYKDFSVKSKIIASLILLSIITISVNLSLWFSPFGWIAWGPRLILPSLVLMSFTAFIFFREFNIPLFSRLNKIFLAGFISVSYLMFLTLFGFLKNTDIWKIWFEKVIGEKPLCNPIPIWEIAPKQFIECNNYLMWTMDSLPLNSILNLSNSFSVMSLNNLLLTIGFFGVTFYFIYSLIEVLKIKADFSSRMQ